MTPASSPSRCDPRRTDPVGSRLGWAVATQVAHPAVFCELTVGPTPMSITAINDLAPSPDPQRLEEPPPSVRTHPARSRIATEPAKPAVFLPASAEDFLVRAEQVGQAASSLEESHGVLASRWDFLDTWARMTVALAAALSALSLFQAEAALTAVLAVSTAIGSALNAALDPARRSSMHRASQRRFRQIERSSGKLYESAYARSIRSHDGAGDNAVPNRRLHYQGADAYYFELSCAVLTELGALLIQTENMLEAAEDGAPPLNRFIGQNTDGTPRTRFGLWQLKRQLELQKAVRETFATYDPARDRPGSERRRPAVAKIIP